jgi:hypothetical protein
MGLRVEFWETPEDDIKKAIVKNFEKLKAWYLSLATEYPDDVNYDVLEFIESIANPDKLFEGADHKPMDDLVRIYIGDFCDYGPGKKKSVKDSTFLNIRNYEIEFTLIEERCNQRVAQIWNYILKGKSIIESRNIEATEDVFRYSILSEEECQFLLQELSNHFDVTTPGNLNKIPAIGSVIHAIANKNSMGLLITVA